MQTTPTTRRPRNTEAGYQSGLEEFDRADHECRDRPLLDSGRIGKGSGRFGRSRAEFQGWNVGSGKKHGDHDIPRRSECCGQSTRESG